MNLLIFVLSLSFLGFFVWYLASLQDRIKRWLAVVLAALLFLISGLSLVDFEQLGKKEATTTLGPWPDWVNINPGIDISGGTQFTIELADKEPSAAAMDQAVSVIRKRIDSRGTTEPLIQPTGKNRITVQIPRLPESEKAYYREQLARVAKLEFRMVHPQNDAILAAFLQGNTDVIPFDYEVAPLRDTNRDGSVEMSQIVIKRRAYMTGKSVQSAWPTLDEFGSTQIALRVGSAKEFGDLSKRIIEESAQGGAAGRMAIVLDGTVFSALGFKNNQPIYSAEVQIDGRFKLEEAVELASVLENPLETPVSIIDERGVDPTLGRDSVRAGFQAAFYGLLAVMVFMVLYYRLVGLFGVAALLFNIIIMVGMLAQFGFTLTLPGLAGVILTIGMAVDANVLIFERIREELDAGRNIQQAIKSGFAKAFTSILDANVTTLIAAIILFWQGTGAIQGFAVVLCLGILGSLFSALVVTRAGFDWALHFSAVKRIQITHFLNETRINFMKIRSLALGASAVFVLIAVVTLIEKGDRAMGVDFVGGDLLTLSFDPAHKVPDDRLKVAIQDAGVVTQYMSDGSGENELLTLRTAENQAEAVVAKIQQAYPDAQFETKSLDRVSPTIGNEFKEKALTAVIAGLLVIFAYLAWRFEWSFAVGAIVALIHDVIIALGLFALAGHQFSIITVGAILTVAGYSINDTIIVFDRIRENIRENKEASLSEIINIAINATLSRTLLTSGTTLLAVLALYFFGGVVINDFSLMLLIGIVVGTFSSIFIASPIVLLFGEKATRDSMKEREELEAV
ncbi:MAG: protein translocase subunit SecD [Candidatus Methylacidiphilales bacterium]